LVDFAACGRVLALAYPDRIAQARGGARFRLRNGAGAWVPRDDPLSKEAFLVVAELDADRRDSRVRIAAALAADEIEGEAESATSLAWDAGRERLRATRSRRVDALVLAEVDELVTAGSATTAALLDRVRATNLEALRWTPAARALQARVGFLRRVLGEEWPDLSDAALLAALDVWLPPLLEGATGLGAVDMERMLRKMVGGARVRHVDELAPPALSLGRSGRRVTVDYTSDQPTVAIRVQELFGTSRHPTVAGGRVPVLLQLLSPANRPVQVTSDLPGFWTGSYAAVRKEMKGRYPKHPWPEKPC
jgi:ATP-dependent helicase HrpB